MSNAASSGASLPRLRRTTSEDPDFRDLVVRLDRHLAEMYPDEHSFFNQFNQIEAIRHVVVAYDGDLPVGCGAFKIFPDSTIEIKRMFVALDFRGQRIGKLVLNELENWAAELGFENAILETGVKQPEAIRLYERSGYESIPNYYQYVGVESSVCFGKKLTD